MPFGNCCIGEVGRMEVPPLPLYPLPQCPPDSDHLAEEDLPPSPTLQSGLTTSACFQRGFVDCAEEALRFLVDEEGMPEDSVVVAGLKAHLTRATRQFTPASLAPPTSSTVFAFPDPPPDASIRGKHIYPTAVPSSVRFSPYSTSRPNKHCVTATSSHSDSLLSNRLPSATYTSAASLERVLDSGIISQDNLEGVLRCLQAPVPSLAYPSASVTNSTAVTYCSPAVSQARTLNSSLNDSGLSEASLADEVDGIEHDDHLTDGSQSSYTTLQPINSALERTVPVLERTDSSMSDNTSRTMWSETASNLEDIHSFPTESSPSSQLDLLSSLSSGEHQLIEGGGNTASRIQSLANQILVLLQEEAEAGEESEDEDEEEDEGNATEEEDLDNSDLHDDQSEFEENEP